MTTLLNPAILAFPRYNENSSIHYLVYCSGN